MRPIRSGGRAPIRGQLLGLCRPGLASTRAVLGLRFGPVIPRAGWLRVRWSRTCWRCGEILGLAAIGARVLVAVIAIKFGEAVRLGIPVRPWTPGLSISVRLWITVRLWIPARLGIPARLRIPARLWAAGLDITGRLGVAVRLGHDIRCGLVRTGLACDVGDVARRSTLVKLWAIRLRPAITGGRAIVVRLSIALATPGGLIPTAVVPISIARAAHAVVGPRVPVIRSSSVMRL